MDVFISYETITGRSCASHVKEALFKHLRLHAFVASEDIPKGTKGGNLIDKAIEECRYFFPIMTMGAILSPAEVEREIKVAARLNKAIIPCKPHTISRMQTRTLPVVYELQQIDYYDKEDLAEQIITEIVEREQVKVGSEAVEEEVKDTELVNIQSAVIAMMVDNQLSTLPNPISTAANRTQDMSAFPDTSVCGIDKLSDPHGTAYVALSDKDGYILYQHDIKAGDAQAELVNYISVPKSMYWYTVDANGTVTQYDTAP